MGVLAVIRGRSAIKDLLDGCAWEEQRLTLNTYGKWAETDAKDKGRQGRVGSLGESGSLKSTGKEFEVTGGTGERSLEIAFLRSSLCSMYGSSFCVS